MPGHDLEKKGQQWNSNKMHNQGSCERSGGEPPRQEWNGAE
jgi:hypothetical protein